MLGQRLQSLSAHSSKQPQQVLPLCPTTRSAHSRLSPCNGVSSTRCAEDEVCTRSITVTKAVSSHTQVGHSSRRQRATVITQVAARDRVADVLSTQEPSQEQLLRRQANPEDIVDKQLYEEIKECDTWQDVLEVVADEAPHISLYTATQATSRLLALARTAPTGSAKAIAQINATPAFKSLLAILSAGVLRMSRAQLCNSMHALAQLNVKLSEPVVALYSQRAQQLAPEFNARDIAQLLHGWATMKCNPGTATLDIVGFRTKALLESGAVEAQGMSMILHSLAVLDYRNRLLLNAAAAALVPLLPVMTPQGVANSTWALGKLGQFSYAALAGAVSAFTGSPDKFKTQETCNLLWGLTQHRYHPQAAFGLIINQMIERSASLKPADYAVLFTALGTFGVHPGGQKLTELLGAMRKQLPKFSARELCNIYWGLGLIGEARQPICQQITAMLPDHFETDQLDEGLLRQIFQAFLCGKLSDALEAESGKAGASSSVPNFPRPMMDAMKRAWITSTRANSVTPIEEDGEEAADASSTATDSDDLMDSDPNNGTVPTTTPAAAPTTTASTTSSTAAGGKTRKGRRKELTVKQEIAQIIRSLRVPHDAARQTRDGLVTIDVALKAGEERFIALQIVMEHEHTCNTGQFLGPLQFQAQVLDMNGWEVRYIRAKDMKALSDANKPLFVADLLRSMGVRVRQPGAAGKPAGKAATSGLDMIMQEQDASAANRRRK